MGRPHTATHKRKSDRGGYTITGHALRKQDWRHFVAMRDGSAALLAALVEAGA